MKRHYTKHVSFFFFFFFFGRQTVPAMNAWKGTTLSTSHFFFFFFFLVAKPFPRWMHGGCHCCHSETVIFVVSLLSRDLPSELFNKLIATKCGQFNGCPHEFLHENGLATENPEKRRAYSTYSPIVHNQCTQPRALFFSPRPVQG